MFLVIGVSNSPEASQQINNTDSSQHSFQSSYTCFLFLPGSLTHVLYILALACSLASRNSISILKQ